jgi:hypothetical protein
MTAVPITLAFEDALSEALAEKVLADVGGPLRIGSRLPGQGAGRLRKMVGNLNAAASRAMPVLLLTDLDQASCAPALIRAWLAHGKSPDLIFRVAVREAEAWVLADSERFARFLGVGENRIPADPEALADPKRTLLALVRTCKRGSLKREMLPAKGAMSPMGLGYNSLLCGFVRSEWRSSEASLRSASLRRTRLRIAELAASLA